MRLWTSWARAAAVALAIALGAGLGVGVLPARAEEPASVGWWWVGRPSGAVPAVFSPAPEPPEGGLYVAGDVTGPSGISALRYELGPDVLAFTLTLTVAEANGTIAIDACPSQDEWEPAENGGWDERPEPDCDVASVAGTVDEDQTEVSFSLLRLQPADGVIDIVLVPGDDPETSNPASFSASFEPPGADALTVSEPADTDPPRSTITSSPSFSAPDQASGSPSVAAPLAPPSPSFAPLPEPSTPAAVDEPDEAQTDRPRQATPEQATAASFVDEGFAYPAVLALPLVLLLAASYLGWTLTYPVIRAREER